MPGNIFRHQGQEQKPVRNAGDGSQIPALVRSCHVTIYLRLQLRHLFRLPHSLRDFRLVRGNVSEYKQNKL
jgi:hypothetical protein